MVVAKTVYLFIVLVICAVTDIRYRKIKNCWVLALLSGWLFYAICEWSWNGLADAVIGMLALILVFLPVYLLRAAGAGDVKLAGVVGLYIGIEGAETFLVAMCVCGGCLALGKMIYYRNFRKRMGYFYQYAKQVMLTGHITAYGMPSDKPDVMGLAVPILCGALWQLAVGKAALWL